MNPATGFDFEPLPDGNMLIDLISRLPLVTVWLNVAVRKGPEVAAEVVERFNKRKENHHEGS